jgi:hypothetical protein
MVAIAFAKAPRLVGRSHFRKKHLRSRQLFRSLKAACELTKRHQIAKVHSATKLAQISFLELLLEWVALKNSGV